MALADRLNKIITEQNISKREFARRVGEIVVHNSSSKISVLR